MFKAVLVTLGIMVVLALIPIVHFAGIPFGPFIGGYFGISAASSYGGSPGAKALTFGIWLSGFILAILVLVAVLLIIVTDLNQVLIWLGAILLTLYVGSLGGLGAWYAELKAAGK